MMFLPMLGKTQLATISGKVTDSRNDKLLENVSIFESYSNIGTITNQEGYFKLELHTGELEINISIDGFKKFSKKMVLNCDTTLCVKLEPEVNFKNRNKRSSELHAVAKSGGKDSNKLYSKIDSK